MKIKPSKAALLRALPIASLVSLLVTLALAGCGGASSGATTKAIPLSAIPVKSAAIRGSSLPSRFTCDGENIPPPLEWGAVPTAARELVLFVVGAKPSGGANGDTDSIEWAVAGIDPKLHRIAAGELPPGAHEGLNTHSKPAYSICPAKGHSEKYQFIMYALQPSIKVAQHFGGLPIAVALSQPGTRYSATAEGGFSTSYKRR